VPALIVIPARGGSKGIPRKNLRLLAGQPLITYGIAAARSARCASVVVVSTDDEEIATVSARAGAEVIERPPGLADDTVPLDPVIVDAASRRPGMFDAVISVQPTSPLVKAGHIDHVYETWVASRATAVFTVTDDTHLAWGMENGQPVPLYEARVNRQQLPRRFKETGAIVCVRLSALLERSTRFVPPFAVVELTGPAALDIDDRFDWAHAEAALSTRRVTIVAVGSDRVARQLALVTGLAKHDVRFVVLAEDADGRARCEAQYFPVAVVPTPTADAIAALDPEVVVLDIGSDGAAVAASLERCGVRAIVCDDGSTLRRADVSLPSGPAAYEIVMERLPRLAELIEQPGQVNA
jgi:CMP-N-acetylneuraminic acid synthetase